MENSPYGEKLGVLVAQQVPHLKTLLLVVFWHRRRWRVGQGLEVSSGGGRDISSYLAEEDRIPELLLKMVSLIGNILALSVWTVTL